MTENQHPVPKDATAEAAHLRSEYKGWKKQAKLDRAPFVPLLKAFAPLLHDGFLPANAIRLLIYVMLKANSAGELKQSMKQTALDLGLSISTVSRTFATLEDAGLVNVLQLKEGGSSRVFLRPFPLEPSQAAQKAGER